MRAKLRYHNLIRDKIEIINKSGNLKIRMQLKESFAGEKINIVVYYKNLVTIDACEGSYIFSNEVLDQNNLDLVAKEGAEINLKLEVQNLTSRIVSGGVIDISGSTNNHISTVGSGAVLKTKNLSSKQTYINVSTGGEAEIYTTELVDARVNMGGTIYIYGNPKQVNKKSVLGGTIIVSKE